MSTKIYEAYRLRQAKDFNRVIRIIKDRGTVAVQAKLRWVYKFFSSIIDTKGEKYLKEFNYYYDERGEYAANILARLHTVHRNIGDGFKKSQGSLERDWFDFDVSVTIYPHKGRYYFIPRCDSLMRGTLDFLADMPELEDYAYFNNTDSQLEIITYRQWKARGKTWDAIFDHKPVLFFSLVLCQWGYMFYELDPWFDLCRELRVSENHWYSKGFGLVDTIY